MEHVRFVGKSWRNIARGPGGIVTESPVSWSFKSTTPRARKEQPDFAGTVNMLTLLAKVREENSFVDVLALSQVCLS